MDFLFFMFRYIPFWAIPLIFIAGEFAYMFWLKENMLVFRICAVVAGVNFLFLVFYYWVGGPDRAADFIRSVFEITT